MPKRLIWVSLLASSFVLGQRKHRWRLDPRRSPPVRRHLQPSGLNPSSAQRSEQECWRSPHCQGRELGLVPVGLRLRLGGARPGRDSARAVQIIVLSTWSCLGNSWIARISWLAR
jgi:hypothetical protein